MANIKWAIMNEFDVEGPDPKNGISMVISDTADEGLLPSTTIVLSELTPKSSVLTV